VSEEHEPIVVTDKRRFDPVTGDLRPEPADPPFPQHPDAGETGKLDEAAAELTADLQRVSAEYANYRKRVDRDRLAVVEMATAGVLESLLPILDSIGLARQHGDLDGAFKGVGEALEQVAERYGLERYADKGEPFDPAVHHALVQASPQEGITEAVIAEVLQPGWRLGSGKVLRPAGVAVSEPAAPVPDVLRE
jgi:molecular chaperone GrpE